MMSWLMTKKQARILAKQTPGVAYIARYWRSIGGTPRYVVTTDISDEMIVEAYCDGDMIWTQ